MSDCETTKKNEYETINTWDDLKLKKRENNYLQQIFYKGSSKKGSY